MPPLGAPARLELFPEFAPGLLRLEKHSHVWVLGWLDAASRQVLEVTPKGVSDRGPEGLHGVFAVRSPVRPNPIGLTAAKILRVEGSSIEVDRLDFLDGTPLLDLKPYFVSRDLIFSAANAQIGRPASREALRESLLFQVLHFHGELCSGAALGVRIVEHYRAEVLGMTDPSQWRVGAPLDRGCLVDALLGITRASLGRGSLWFLAQDCVRFEHGDRVTVYRLVAEPEQDPEAILGAGDQALFTVAG